VKIGVIIGGIKSMRPRSSDICQMATELAGLNREELIPRLLNFPSQTRLDFSGEYLNSLSTDRLRHILLAAIICLS